MDRQQEKNLQAKYMNMGQGAFFVQTVANLPSDAKIHVGSVQSSIQIMH